MNSWLSTPKFIFVRDMCLPQLGPSICMHFTISLPPPHVYKCALAAGMSSSCYNAMDPKQFKELPSSTNAVESYNRLSKFTHRQPLKQAMMIIYKEDMANSLEIMAVRKGLSVTYDNLSNDGRMKRSSQQNLARQKRYHKENDDPDGPPDTKRKFNPSNNIDVLCLTVVCTTTGDAKHKSAKPKNLTLSLKGNKSSDERHIPATSRSPANSTHKDLGELITYVILTTFA